MLHVSLDAAPRTGKTAPLDSPEARAVTSGTHLEFSGAIATSIGRRQVSIALVRLADRLGSSPFLWRADCGSAGLTVPGHAPSEVRAVLDVAGDAGLFRLSAS